MSLIAFLFMISEAASNTDDGALVSNHKILNGFLSRETDVLEDSDEVGDENKLLTEIIKKSNNNGSKLKTICYIRISVCVVRLPDSTTKSLRLHTNLNKFRL